MIKHLLALSCICFLFACGSNSSETNTADKQGFVNETHCYVYNDTDHIITLTAHYLKDSVYGTLAYDIHEIDKNSGSFAGQVKNDMLVVNYTYTLDGKTSVRQVVFKKSGSSLIGAIGEMEEKNGKMVYKDVNNLSVQPAIVLTETDCNKK